MSQNSLLQNPDALHYYAVMKGSGQSVVPAQTVSFYDLDVPEA